MARQLEDDILRALRRITRAIDLHSRWLANNYGLTGPQLVCLRVIGHRGRITPSELAREVSLSQATVTGIVDRLAARQLVQRERSSQDRRVVTISVVAAGEALIQEAPSPLQEQFVLRLAALSEREQSAIRDTLDRIVEMMGGGELAAAPVLATSPVAQASDELQGAVNGASAAVDPLSAEVPDPLDVTAGSLPLEDDLG